MHAKVTEISRSLLITTESGHRFLIEELEDGKLRITPDNSQGKLFPIVHVGNGKVTLEFMKIRFHPNDMVTGTDSALYGGASD